MIPEEANLTVTEQVFRALCRRADDLYAAIAATGIGAEHALAAEEVTSALRALELTGLITIATRADTIDISLTEKGMDRCRQHTS